MLGLYIHIPWCAAKCAYCDFFSLPTRPDRIPQDEYLRALTHQMDDAVARGMFEGREVGSIYIGGGTPSLMPSAWYARLLDAVRARCRIDADAEITCEANPATADASWFSAMAAHGVTRLSLGVQSFRDDALTALGRVHTAADALRAIAEAQDAGFSSVSVDLMFGLPHETIKEVEHDLRTAMTFQPQHISAYQLTIEEGTPLAACRAKDTLMIGIPSDDDVLTQLRLVKRMLSSGGWEPYEISNFAKKGYACRHNLNYWRYGEYLGLGAGATSFMTYGCHPERSAAESKDPLHFLTPMTKARDSSASCASGTVPYVNASPSVQVGRNDSNYSRWTMTRDLARYLHDPIVEDACEELSPRTAEGEFCFMGLRMSEGIARDEFTRRFGVSLDDVFPGVVASLAAEGLAIDEGGRLTLTPRGRELSNTVFTRFVE